MGIDLAPRASEQLLEYLALLARWNKTYNLTAVREPREMLPLHLLDSLAVLPHLRDASLLDVGTGAGLPGMVVALMQPERSVSLLDSNGKKTRFLRQVVRQLRPGNVDVIEARCQAVRGRQWPQVISRAFAALPSFAEQAGHCVAPGGYLIAMQARRQDAPPENGEYSHEQDIMLSVPGIDAPRRLSIWRKTEPTPASHYD
jgi:16S rRNA (guanine527-N7)-methyltransferase